MVVKLRNQIFKSVVNSGFFYDLYDYDINKTNVSDNCYNVDIS